MPAKDRLHDTVKRALVKDGWKVVDEQVRLNIGARRLWIDLYAIKEDLNLACLVEVKGFQNVPSLVDEMAKTIGQYFIYQVVLSEKSIPLPIYVAVPDEAFQGILSEEIGLLIREALGIKLLVFDPITERVIKWKT
jgi:hypothetical protein